MMVMRIITILIITILIIIFDSVAISKLEYELTTLGSSKQVSKDHWVETRPPGGGMQQHHGCRWNCFAWSSPVGGRESRGASVHQVFEGGGNYGGCSGQEEDR